MFKTKIGVSPFGLRMLITEFKDYHNKNLIALNELNYNIDYYTLFILKRKMLFNMPIILFM